MKSLLLCLVVVVCLITGCASTASANDYGITLAPGEVLVAVNGVPVNQPMRMTYQPIRNAVGPVVFAPVRAAAKVMRCTVDAFGIRRCR